MKRRFFTVWFGVAFGLAIVVFAPAASAWAPAGQANIHSGVMTFTEGAQCTSNFISSGSSGVYIGQAAHCSGTGSTTETDEPLSRPPALVGVGVLSTLQILPTAGSNGVGDLDHELDYLRANRSFSNVQLEPGTKPFNPNLGGAILGG